MISNDSQPDIYDWPEYEHIFMPLSCSGISSSVSVSLDSDTTGSSYDYGNYINNQNLDQNDIFSSQDDITSYDEPIIDNNLYFLSNIGTRSDSDYYDIQTTADLTTSHETFSTCASVVSSTDNTYDTVFTSKRSETTTTPPLPSATVLLQQTLSWQQIQEHMNINITYQSTDK